MKILVTGGAGYIGSIVVEQLIAEGESVVVFDNLSQGHRAAVHPRAVFVEGDLTVRPAIDAAIATHRPEAVMHFASHTLVGESMQRPFMYLGANVVGGINLLESMVQHGVKRFILSSTANLFDAPERMPIDEQERIVPGSPYGESKHILERMLYWLDRVQGLRYAGAAVFQRRRGERRARRRSRPRVASDSHRAASRARAAGRCDDLRRGLCDARRHLRPRLHPHRRSRPSPPAGVAGARGRKPRVQSGQRTGIQRARGHRNGPANHPSGDPLRGPAHGGRAIRPRSWPAARKSAANSAGSRAIPQLDQIIETAWDWHRRHPHGYDD